jgi:hypothetical protein
MDGYKTYIGMIAAGVLGLLVAFDVVTWDQVDWLAIVIGSWTGVAVAHKGNKLVGAVKNGSGRT